MPIIKAAELGADYEDKAVPEGNYAVRIVKSDFGKSKVKADGSGGNPMLTFAIKVEGSEGEGAALINEFLIVPPEGSQHFRMQMRTIQRFLKVFGWDLGSDFDPERDHSELVGAEANVFLRQEEDDQGTVRNRLKLPKAA